MQVSHAPYRGSMLLLLEEETRRRTGGEQEENRRARSAAAMRDLQLLAILTSTLSSSLGHCPQALSVLICFDGMDVA